MPKNKNFIKSLLFNPVSIVHYRNIHLFAESFSGYSIKCILNPKFPWVSKINKSPYEIIYFKNDDLPKHCFDGVEGVIVFSAQPRVTSLMLIQRAALRKIPVIAVEEVYQMMLEQGYVNEYFIPVDALFAASEFEKKKFIDFGITDNACHVSGCIFTKTQEIHARERQKNSEIYANLGLKNYRPVAVLILAYQTPSGETLSVREDLLKIVSGGLPVNYQLLVKPHPAEDDKKIDSFVRRFAPDAKIANKYTPIGEILNITDVLFNRGNSQVIIDALRRNIPVIPIPLGRVTFFHNILDQLIVKDKNDVVNALELIQKKGFALYEPIFKEFLSIDPDTALRYLIKSAGKIFEEKRVRNTAGRITDIALYWAWMGHIRRSLRLIQELKKCPEGDVPALDSIVRLIKVNPLPPDRELLKRWSSTCQYRNWLIKSLWIKNLYLKGRGLTSLDKEWFFDFPPRTNREYFIGYAYMLGKCYLKSGMRAECDVLLKEIYSEYRFLKCIEALKNELEAKNTAWLDINYLHIQLNNLIGAPLF